LIKVGLKVVILGVIPHAKIPAMRNTETMTLKTQWGGYSHN